MDWTDWTNRSQELVLGVFTIHNSAGKHNSESCAWSEILDSLKKRDGTDWTDGLVGQDGRTGRKERSDKYWGCRLSYNFTKNQFCSFVVDVSEGVGCILGRCFDLFAERFWIVFERVADSFSMCPGGFLKIKQLRFESQLDVCGFKSTSWCRRGTRIRRKEFHNTLHTNLPDMSQNFPPKPPPNML